MHRLRLILLLIPVLTGNGRAESVSFTDPVGDTTFDGPDLTSGLLTNNGTVFRILFTFNGPIENHLTGGDNGLYFDMAMDIDGRIDTGIDSGTTSLPPGLGVDVVVLPSNVYDEYVELLIVGNPSPFLFPINYGPNWVEIFLLSAVFPQMQNPVFMVGVSTNNGMAQARYSDISGVFQLPTGAAVPEPSTLAMAALGGLGLIAILRKRRK